MATVLENLQTAQANIAQQIADITANPKPTYTIDGQTVKWTEHLRALFQEQARINDLIAANEIAVTYTQGHAR